MSKYILYAYKCFLSCNLFAVFFFILAYCTVYMSFGFMLEGPLGTASDL